MLHGFFGFCVKWHESGIVCGPSGRTSTSGATKITKVLGGAGVEQVSDFLFDVVLGRERPGNLISQKLAVASAETVDCGPDGAFRHAQLFGHNPVCDESPISRQKDLQTVEEPFVVRLNCPRLAAGPAFG